MRKLKFDTPKFKITKDSVICLLRFKNIYTEQVKEMQKILSMSFSMGGIRPKSLENRLKCFLILNEPYIGEAHLKPGDLNDIASAKRIAFEKAKRLAYKRLYRLYSELFLHVNHIKKSILNNAFTIDYKIAESSETIIDIAENQKQCLDASHIYNPMDHEILFRGKRIDNGQWVVGFPLRKDTPDLHCYIISTFEAERCTGTTGISGSEMYEVYPESIGQYTNVLDSNHTRIFEGDIIEAVHNSHPLHTSYIKFDNGTYWCELISGSDIDDTESLYDQSLDLGLTVIGNIYDNPELLECSVSEKN